MSKISSVFSSLVNRRSYSVYAYARAMNSNVRATATSAGPADDSAAADGAGRLGKKDVFWMRDPKTGCWVPENRFLLDDIDAVELRNRLLPYKK